MSKYFNVIVKLRNVNESNSNKYPLLPSITHLPNSHLSIKLHWSFWNINEIFSTKIMNTRRYSIDYITKSTINVEGEIIRRNETYNNK